MRMHSSAIGVAAALLLGSAVVACGGGLSDEAYNYCINEAPGAELDAAAEALNIAPDADRNFDANRSRSDPTFQRVCEYAWNARSGDMDVPANPVNPGDVNPSAPLDPQRSQDAASPPAPASPAAS